MAVIYLIRHGQASWGKLDYDALSKLGTEQAQVLGRALKRRIGPPDRVIVGGMRRHRQTAKHALTAMDVPLHWQEDESWNEYDHEELIVRHKPLYRSRALMIADLARTLKPRQAFQEFFEQALERWVSGKHDAEYAESWPAFKARVQSGLERLAAEKHGTTLVFTSGGAISAAVRELWSLPDTHWSQLNRVVANAAITKLVVGRQGTHLMTFNEHSHFEGKHSDMLTYR